MLNQTVLVGRIVSEPVRKDLGDDKIGVTLNLAVQRSYKNVEGIYETDMIPVELWNAVASNVLEYCKVGDLVGVKGRLQQFENSIGEPTLKLVAEKVSFLAAKNASTE